MLERQTDRDRQTARDRNRQTETERVTHIEGREYGVTHPHIQMAAGGRWGGGIHSRPEG